VGPAGVQTPLPDFEDDNRVMTAALAGFPGLPFAVVGNSLSRDSVQVGGNVTVQVADSLDLFASYDGVLSNRSDTHAAEVGARFSF
jgi:uncharacterized protein with beta-barrel porin domain